MAEYLNLQPTGPPHFLKSNQEITKKKLNENYKLKLKHENSTTTYKLKNSNENSKLKLKLKYHCKKLKFS